MRQDLREGARLFNDGHYWEAHESWEKPWMTASGEERAYIQALILLAAALHKRWAHGSLTGRNFHKARRYLGKLPGVFDGVDLARLSQEVEAALTDPTVCPRLPVSD